MELRQLEYLVAVAEEESFTKAAARLHVAQPGVSAQVRRLERELGQELLDRSGRSVSLTGAGAAVLPHARTALAAVTGVRDAVDELTGLRRGHVAVGVVAACGGVDLPTLLAEFHRAQPAVEISLAESTSDVLLDDLRTGRLDMAIAGIAGEAPEGIATQVVVDEPLVAAVAPGHPLAGRESVTLAALAEHPLISLGRGTGLRAAFDAACARAGVEARIAFEAGDPNTLARLAAEGLGAALLPEMGARAVGLHVVAITRPRIRSRLELAWRADGPTSPAAHALITHARAWLR